jgi:hypothetical protein
MNSRFTRTRSRACLLLLLAAGAIAFALAPTAGSARSISCDNEACPAFSSFTNLDTTIATVLHPADPVKPEILKRAAEAESNYPGDFHPADPVKPAWEALRKSYHGFGELGNFVLDHTGTDGHDSLTNAQGQQLVTAIGAVQGAPIWTIAALAP